MSKGSGRRPSKVKDNHVASEWDRLFGKKNKKNEKKDKK